MRAHMQAFPLFDAMPGRGGTMCAHVRHCAGHCDLCVFLLGEGGVGGCFKEGGGSCNMDTARIQEMRSLSLAGTSDDTFASPLPLSLRLAPPPSHANLPQLHVKSPSICVLISAPPPSSPPASPPPLRLAEWPLH